MFDVGGRDEVDARQPRDGDVESTERLDHGAATVGAGAATETDDDSHSSRLEGGGDQLADSPAVGVEGGLHRGWSAEQRQTAGLGALDVGGARPGVQHPFGGHVFGQRATDDGRAETAETTGQDVHETGTAVGLRGERQPVRRPALLPPGGNGVGGLHGRQRVSVAVRGDQHAQCGTRHRTTVSPGGRRCMPGAPVTK